MTFHVPKHYKTNRKWRFSRSPEIHKTGSSGHSMPSKTLEKQWYDKLFALVTKPCKKFIKTCRLWRPLEAFLQKWSKQHPKSVTFIDKTQRWFSISGNLIKPVGNVGFGGARIFTKRGHLDIACPQNDWKGTGETRSPRSWQKSCKILYENCLLYTSDAADD